MGSSSACEQCGKKFKVFAKRKKCMHCMTTVCKHCYAPHVASKHPSAAVRMATPPSRGSLSRQHARDRQQNATIGAPYELSGRSSEYSSSVMFDDEDVHFLSPVNADGSRSGLEYDEDLLLDGIEHVDVMSAGEDEDEDDDEEEEEEDEEEGEGEEEEEEDDETEAYLGEDRRLDDAEQHRAAAGRFQKRRMSMEEEHYQYAEFMQIQDAVATWARKERDATRKQRIAERDSCYSMTPIPNVRSTREYQERELFVVSYAVAVTLLVWVVYAAGSVAYIRARGEVVRALPFIV